MTLDVDAVYEAIAVAVNEAELQGNTAKVLSLAFAPDAIITPQFFLAEFDGTYDRSYGGLMELTITARLMLSRASDEFGQAEARRLAGSGENTIRAAINAARGAPGQKALDGAADDIYLRRVTGPRLYDYGESHYYGLEFTIFVMG